MLLSKQSLVIFATAIFLSITFIDETGIAVTLPKIQSELSLSSFNLNWVMNSFFLMLAVGVLGAGRLSDIIGHRKIFLTGVVIFMVASLMAATADSATTLIVGRGIQGVGACFMLATYAVLLARVFPPEKQGMALGSSTSIASFFLATGPFIGGAVSELWSWRYIFFINIPICMAIIWAICRAIPKDAHHFSLKMFDWLGLVTFMVGFSGLVVGLMQAPVWGWDDSRTILAFILSALGLGSFVIAELRTSQPLADLRLFKNREFLSVNIVLLTTQICALVIVFWSLWLSYSMNMPPLSVGLALLPAGLPILFVARWGGMWADRSGSRSPIIAGTFLCLMAMIWMAMVLPLQIYWLAAIGMVLYAIGAPLVISPAIKTILMAVPEEKIGAASGILNTMRNLGAALCLSLIGTAINVSTQHSLQLQQGKNLYFLTPPYDFHELFSQAVNTRSIETVAKLQTQYALASGIGMWVTSTFALLGFCLACYGLQRSKV